MTGHVHLAVNTLVNKLFKVTSHVGPEHVFQGSSLHSGEVMPVVSMEDLFDMIPQRLGYQYPQPQVTVVIDHDIQLVLRHQGEV